MAPVSPLPANDAGRVVARNLRALREERGFSLSELARASGVAKGTISKLEAGIATNPTVETLWALADALGGALADLVAAPAPSLRVARCGRAQWIGGASLDVRILDRLAGREVHDVAHVRFAKGRRREAGPHAAGATTHVFVLAGRLRIGCAGEELELERDDYASVAADAPHWYEGLHAQTSALVLVSLPARRDRGGDVARELLAAS